MKCVNIARSKNDNHKLSRARVYRTAHATEEANKQANEVCEFNGEKRISINGFKNLPSGINNFIPRQQTDFLSEKTDGAHFGSV